MAKQLKKWFKWMFGGGIVLGLACWLASTMLLRHWTAKPPPLPADTSIMQLKAETHDGKVWLGKSWSGRREGLMVVHLKGGPFEMGYADGLLMQQQMHTLEDEFLKMIQGYVPQHWVMEGLKNYVIYRNRHLTDYVPMEYRQEIYGASLACTDTHPEEGSFYNRLLNYHAAHDVSYMMIDNPLVSHAGCTAFGAWGAATENGHLLTARNFDWEAAEVFSRDRVVMIYEPADGIPFISLSWAGMAGVVSGMNRAGLSVTLNGAPSSLPRETATPAGIVAREILQTSHNLSEAIGLLKNAKVFVSTLWLVGSQADGKFVVVEKTPERTEVREPEGNFIISANHFQTEALKEQPRNKNYTEESTSVSRAERMRELVQLAQGRLDAAGAAEILRDRKLPGGRFAGNGHRATLNAFIATHGTVMDLTEGIFWAASPPNQLGKFVAFDVQDFDHELPERTVPPDQTLVTTEYENARKAHEALIEGHRLLRSKECEGALAQADKAERLNPGFYQNASLRGQALLRLGRNDEAAKAFEAALAAQPAFRAERIELASLLKQAQSAK